METKSKGLVPAARLTAKFKINLRLMNSFGPNTTLMKYDEARKVWIVTSSYYPHITTLIAECKKRRTRFSLDHKGFKAVFDPEKCWLDFMPRYGKGKWRTSAIPYEYRREMAAYARMRKNGKISKEEFNEQLKQLKVKYDVSEASHYKCDTCGRWIKKAQKKIHVCSKLFTDKPKVVVEDLTKKS